MISLKAKELIEILQKVSDDTPVVLAKDAEGNDFSPLDSWSQHTYEPINTWAGVIYSDDDVELGDSEPSEDAFRAVVLWPTS